MSDQIWKKRADDEAAVRTALTALLALVREPDTRGNPELTRDLHGIIATHLTTLERFTRPIPIVLPFGLPLAVFEDVQRRWEQHGIPIVLQCEIAVDDPPSLSFDAAIQVSKQAIREKEAAYRFGCPVCDWRTETQQECPGCYVDQPSREVLTVLKDSYPNRTCKWCGIKRIPPGDHRLFPCRPCRASGIPKEFYKEDGKDRTCSRCGNLFGLCGCPPDKKKS